MLVVFGKSIGRLKALDFTLYHSFMFGYNFGISCFLLRVVYLFNTTTLMSNPCVWLAFRGSLNLHRIGYERVGGQSAVTTRSGTKPSARNLRVRIATLRGAW